MNKAKRFLVLFLIITYPNLFFSETHGSASLQAEGETHGSASLQAEGETHGSASLQAEGETHGSASLQAEGETHGSASLQANGGETHGSASLQGVANAQTTQERIVPIKFGDMESWTVRYIKESALLGGKTKTLYVLAPKDTIRKNKAYDFSKTIWGISNAYASPAGVDKGANTTQPEKRGKGTCARLDTRIETVKVLGFIDIEVCIAGTLFLGKVCEPVKSTNDPYASIDVGIPFTGRPKALLLDIKAQVNPERKVLKATGFSKKKWIEGHDEPEVYVYLQKRWEDEKGNIYAKRIGTVRHRFSKSIPEWHNNYRMDIDYGDITGKPYFKKYMGLFPDGGEFKARNSKGKMVKIQEVGWADANEKPTHVILQITAGCYPAFYGYPGNALWVDNIRWVY